MQSYKPNAFAQAAGEVQSFATVQAPKVDAALAAAQIAIQAQTRIAVVCPCGWETCGRASIPVEIPVNDEDGVPLDRFGVRDAARRAMRKTGAA